MGETLTEGKEAGADVVRITDRRTAGGNGKKPPAETSDNSAPAGALPSRERRIAAAAQSGMEMLRAELEMGREPQKRVLIAALLEADAGLRGHARVFQSVGRSFDQVADALGKIVAYLLAEHRRRALPWYRRWLTPRAPFPRFDPSVASVDGKPLAAAPAAPPAPTTTTQTEPAQA